MKNAMRAFFSLFVAISVLVEPQKPFSLLAPRSSTSKTDNLAFELSQIPPLPFLLEGGNERFWLNFIIEEIMKCKTPKNAKNLKKVETTKVPSASELVKMSKMFELKWEDIKNMEEHRIAAESLGAAVAAKRSGAFQTLKKALKSKVPFIREAAVRGMEPALRAKFYGVFELLKQKFSDNDGNVREAAVEVLGTAVAVSLTGALELFEEKFTKGSWYDRWGAGRGLKVVLAAKLPKAFEMLKESLFSMNNDLNKILAENLGAAVIAEFPDAVELFKKVLSHGVTKESAVLGLKEGLTNFVSNQQKTKSFLRELSIEKSISILFFLSEKKGKNFFQLYYEKNKNLKFFEKLSQMDENLLWKGLYSFKYFFEEEFKQDISLIEAMTEFLQTLQNRKMTENFDFEVMRKIKKYLSQNKLSFKEFFNQLKEKELFYEHLKFLNENSEYAFGLPLEWLRSDLSEKFFNAQVGHRMGETLLKALVQAKSGEREIIFKQIFEKIKDEKIWQEEDITSFKNAAETFGYGALFEYLGRRENVHEALFQMNDILTSYRLMGISKGEFVSNILLQVAKDKSVDYEGNNSYTRFNQCAAAFTKLAGGWKKLLEEEKEISDPKFLRLKESFLKTNNAYKSWNNFQKLIQTVQMVQRKEVFKKIEKLKEESIGGEKLYNYFSFLLFHPALKNTKAVEQFLEEPKEFLAINDAHSVEQLHQAKKPSQYLRFPYIDLSGEELRNALVLGKIDSISVFSEMKIDFYSYLDTEGLPILLKKMKSEWEQWLLEQEIFQSIPQTNIAQTRIPMKQLLEKGAKLKEEYQTLEAELREGELPKSMERGFRNWVVEQYQTNVDFQKKVQKFWGGKDLGEKYTAQILAKSNPLAMVTGNECPSCMAFGSGKNNVYLFNPNVGIFVITKEVKDSEAEGDVRDRAIVQSVLTLDRKIPHLVSELKAKLDSALKEKNASNLDLTDFVGNDFLDKISPDAVIALDNREAATNFINLTENGNFQAWVDKLSTLFFQEYVSKNPMTPAGRDINQEFAVVGLGYSEFLGEMKKIDNYFLPQAPVPYSDKTGEQVGRLPIFEKSLNVEAAAPRRRGVQKISFEDTLEVAFVENSVYKGFPENYKNHLAGIETELIAAEINEAVKGDRRKNLSRGYYDKSGKLLGYMIAYAGYDKAKKEEVIFVSDIAVLPEYQKQWGIGGKLLASFARDAAKLNLPIIANLRVAENGSYDLIKKWSQNSGAQLEESEPYEIAPGVQAIDVRIPTLLLPNKTPPLCTPHLDLESAA